MLLIMKNNSENKENQNQLILTNKFLNILIEFSANIESKEQIFKKKFYFIIVKTLELIKFIFIYTLLHTSDNDLIILYTEKGYLYFIEFMEQINSESNNVLDLSYKDAKLFVYKKTIFNLDKNNDNDNDNDNDNFYKNNNNDLLINEHYKKKMIYNIEIIVNITNLLIKQLFDTEKNNFIEEDIFKKNIKKIVPFIDSINGNLFLESIQIFSNNFQYNHEINVFNYMKLFIQKVNKKNVNIVTDKLNSIDNKNNIINLSEYKYFKWLFS